jgi:hypothetical protein
VQYSQERGRRSYLDMRLFVSRDNCHVIHTTLSLPAVKSSGRYARMVVVPGTRHVSPDEGIRFRDSRFYVAWLQQSCHVNWHHVTILSANLSSGPSAPHLSSFDILHYYNTTAFTATFYMQFGCAFKPQLEYSLRHGFQLGSS